ncbi:hypothetical protein FB451DRAFT_1034470, partial [Mycena latifolia]
FPFACRCGNRGPDGAVFANGLAVVQCATCNMWSHISCQRYGRASKLGPRKQFSCDSLFNIVYQVQRLRCCRVGMGALVKIGKYHYPVRLLQKEKGDKGWTVKFWRGCQFKAGQAPSPLIPIPESDLVDSLYGNRPARRAIRLGKYTHAHEIQVEEDVLFNFLDVPFTLELDTVLAPYTSIISSIITRPIDDHLHIPAVAYLITKNKTSVPFTGNLTLLEQAQIMNWFHYKIPAAAETGRPWVGCAAHAHTITIFLANRHEKLLREAPGFPTAGSDAAQLKALWRSAWAKQKNDIKIKGIDVDLECLSLLEQWIFESSDEAGIAGDEQWGLDAGNHQDRWVPYKGNPQAWSSYRSDAQDETIFEVSFSLSFAENASEP